MEGKGLAAQYVHSDNPRSHKFSENKKELPYEQAEVIYNDGQKLREHIYEISGKDALFCTQVFNEVYEKIFSDINAEERAKHIMHRVLTGTSISPRENVVYVADERDRYIYEKFLMRMSRAQSKKELQQIADILYREDVIGRSVQ